jgi:hypothetical protein
MTADRNYVGTVQRLALKQSNGGISETLRNPMVKSTDVIDRTFAWLSDGANQLRPQFFRVFDSMGRYYVTAPFPETDQRNVDAVHAGSGHQAEIQVAGAVLCGHISRWIVQRFAFSCTAEVGRE